MGEQPRMLIAVDQGEIQLLRQEISDLRRLLEAATITPRSPWVTAPDYAKRIGRSVKTIRAWVREGRLDTKREGSVLMIRAPEADP